MAGTGNDVTFWRGTVLPFLRSTQEEPSGLKGSAVVLGVCGVGAFALWDLLGIPPRLIGSVIPDVTCTRLQPGTPGMYACSMGVASLVVAGPLLTLVLVYVFRRQLMRLAAWAAPRLPTETRFLLAPLIATAVFGMAWAGMHPQTGDQVGLLPQRLFPCVAGLFSYLVVRFAGPIQQRLARFFDMRERYPVWQRFVAAIVTPMLLALLLTAQERVSQTALKEQVVVLVAMVTGYLALAPRTGDLLAGVKDVLPLERLRAR
jgi:hypothetical protein